jgi:phage shock protein A
MFYSVDELADQDRAILYGEIKDLERELAELRQALDALLEIAEQVVDPETCSAGIRRAMDDARRALDRARQVGAA